MRSKIKRTNDRLPPPRTMLKPKFYVSRRDTRWDVYPQQEPEEVIAHDYYGFWGKTKDGRWFLSPSSYVLGREISKEEADTYPGIH